jgi:hypothetical protein
MRVLQDWILFQSDSSLGDQRAGQVRGSIKDVGENQWQSAVG